MPDQVANTEDLANTTYDAGRLDDAGETRDASAARKPEEGLTDATSSEPLPVPGEDAEVGLAQKGTGEAAVVRRETEI